MIPFMSHSNKPWRCAGADGLAIKLSGQELRERDGRRFSYGAMNPNQAYVDILGQFSNETFSTSFEEPIEDQLHRRALVRPDLRDPAPRAPVRCATPNPSLDPSIYLRH